MTKIGEKTQKVISYEKWLEVIVIFTLEKTG